MKKLLAIVLAATMLFGMFTFNVSAATLTDLVPTNALVWAATGWSPDITPYAFDNNTSTEYNQGKHGVTEGYMMIKVSNDGSVKYNKFRVTVTRYNTQYISLYGDNSLTAGEPSAAGAASASTLSTRNLLARHTLATASTESGVNETITLTFDTANYKYLRFGNQIADNTKEGFKASEMELLYATPASIKVSAKNSYSIGTAGTITPSAVVYDAEGDELKDSTLNKVTWSINSGATGVSVDASTGVVTISADAPEQSVTLTATSSATGFSSIKKSATIKLVDPTQGLMIADFSDGTEHANWELKDGAQTTSQGAPAKNTSFVKGTSANSAAWTDTDASRTFIKTTLPTKDFSAYTGMYMWVYSENATGATMGVNIYDSAGAYTRRTFVVDWTGWKVVPVMYSWSTGANHADIVKIIMTSSGWGSTPDKNTKLYFDSIWLSNADEAVDYYGPLKLTTSNNVATAKINLRPIVNNTNALLLLASYDSSKMLTNLTYTSLENFSGDVTVQCNLKYASGESLKAQLLRGFDTIQPVIEATTK